MIYATIVIVLVTILVILFLFRSDKAQKQQQMITLLITLVGTFGGVFVATYMTEIEKTKETHIRLLSGIDQAIQEVDASAIYFDITLSPILAKYENQKNQILMRNPLKKLNTVDRLIESPSFQDKAIFLSGALISLQNSLNENIQQLRSPDSAAIDLSENLTFYRENLKDIDILLRSLKDYLNGDLSEGQLRELERIHLQLIGPIKMPQDISNRKANPAANNAFLGTPASGRP